MKSYATVDVELLSMVSHEMRTPLTAILAFTDLILAEKTGALKPLQREFVTSVQLSAKRLGRLAEHILDLYCVESGQFRIGQDILHIADIVAWSVKQNELVAREAGVHLAFEECPNLPPVVGDRRRLQHVLMELELLAIKDSAEGARVVVSAERAGQELKVVVGPNRAGVSADDRKWDFDASCGGDDFESAVNQFGLGLRVAKVTVEQHGGRIWIESGRDKVASYCFSLPLKKL